jgi:hypothetical protein
MCILILMFYLYSFYSNFELEQSKKAFYIYLNAESQFKRKAEHSKIPTIKNNTIRHKTKTGFRIYNIENFTV